MPKPEFTIPELRAIAASLSRAVTSYWDESAGWDRGGWHQQRAAKLAKATRKLEVKVLRVLKAREEARGGKSA